MSNVIKRITGSIYFSPKGLEAAMRIPQHYRVVEGNTVREATSEEKDMIDGERLPLLKMGRIASYCDMVQEKLLISTDKTAEALAVDAAAINAEFLKVVGLAKAAENLQELRDITTTLEALG